MKQNYPKIGIRPTIDGRQGGIREGLEEKTMNLAKAVKNLIESTLKNGDGSKVECVISDTTIGRVGESAACAEKFEREGVGSTITVTSCWCYGSETMDMNPQYPKAVWMQANPQLTAKDIKKVLQETCRNDKFTTDTEFIPSHNPVQAGYGKIDAVAGLKKILNITAIETIEAGGHREATPATMYSVDAPVYNMMGQRIDKNTRGLVVYKGRKYMNQ